MPSKSKARALFFILKLLMLNALPPLYACGPCTQPSSPYHQPKTPPHHGGGRPKVSPPLPPIIINPPPTTPYPAPKRNCPIDALKLGLCLDVLGGLVHVGIGKPIENVCCPVIRGLVELEAAICLCTVIRAKLLNLNIFLPLALQVLITCGKNPPPAFVCPPL
ncbi:hypothetical protein VNO77_24940 [Canavalia gladiata]|uniref:Bifunctional inhibitor/plant lipid transfer protein/seed storage helical domain-containing protein n=1 Tax=Canavalia gladiata TaxID=3824 RepID=A0AAN9QD14_CANGL